MHILIARKVVTSLSLSPSKLHVVRVCTTATIMHHLLRVTCDVPPGVPSGRTRSRVCTCVMNLRAAKESIRMGEEKNKNKVKKNKSN